MKVSVRFNRRLNFVVLLFACAASIAMMVVRFGLTVDTIVQVAWIAVVVIGGIVIIAAPIALLIRWLVSRRDSN